MIFLDAATGLAALGAGVSLTLLWYFLKLRRRPMRVSSTMLWSSAARDLEVNAPLRWIRPSWLLVLQLLAVALLSGAAGRPAASGAEGAPGRWVLVIDRSASMSARDGEGGATRLEEAVERAGTIVRRMGSGERAMVASFAGTARVEAAMTSDRGVLLAALEGIGPTDQPGDAGAAMGLVAAQLGEDAAGARVVVLSDGGIGDGELSAAIGEAGVRFTRVGPAEAEASWNTGVVAVSARRDADDPAALRVFVRVRHAGGGPREAVVSVFFNDELAGTRTLEVEAGGSASAVFETRRVEAGVVRASIAGRDVLGADDAAHVVVPGARVAGAVIVTPEGVGADPFLERAVEVATREAPAVVTVGEWDGGGAPGASFVVFDRCEPAVAPGAPSLHLGAGAPFAGVRMVRYGSDGSSRRVLAWERGHEATRRLALDAVVIGEAEALEWDEGVGAAALAVSEDGPVLAAVESGGRRRLVSSVGPAGSNWETDPSFPLFVVLAAEWLAPSTTGAGESYTTGEGVAVRGAAGSTEVVARGPEERRAAVQGDGLARFGFERAGVYRLEGAEAGVVAVNLLDETETSVATRDSVRVAGEDVGASGVDAVTVRELWRWFVAAGLALACVEWAVYAVRMRV